MPVVFHRQQAAFSSKHVAPLLHFSEAGRQQQQQGEKAVQQAQLTPELTTPVLIETGDAAALAPFFQVRHSYFTFAPFNRPFSEMEAWYRAYGRFSRLIRDPRSQYRAALAPGDIILYDNWRMLHGRTGFQGSRWMRGIYFDDTDDDASTSSHCQTH